MLRADGFSFKVGVHKLKDRSFLSIADKISHPVELLQFFFLPVDHAPGDNYHGILLPFRRLVYRLTGFNIALVGDGAGINNINISILSETNNFVIVTVKLGRKCIGFKLV